MTSVTKTLDARQVADGIVHVTETTQTSTWNRTTETKAWLDGDRVHVSIGPAPAVGLARIFSREQHPPQADNYAPGDAEYLGNLLLELARQARAVQARKPWTGGPLSSFSSRRG